MRIAQEEIFGPVLCVIPYKDEDEAVSIANDTKYGLAGAIWSKDIGRAQKLARRIRTGTMWINDYNILSDYAPYGGYKQSGVGRQFGFEGLAAFTQTKLLYTSPEGAPDRATFGGVFAYATPSDTFSYYGPTKLNAGPGCVSTLAKEIDRLGGKRAVIITDKGLVAAGIVDQVKMAAGNSCVGVFDGVEPDSGYDIVDRAVELCRDVKADCVVSLGGGSSMDTAKVTAVCATIGGKAIENAAIMRLAGPVMPHIAIPTTHGTGCGIALPHSMRFNRDCCLPELARVAEALGVATKKTPEAEAADAAIEEITALMKRIGHPTKFSEVCAPTDPVEVILMGTLTDLSTFGNPRPLSDPAPVLEMIKASL